MRLVRSSARILRGWRYQYSQAAHRSCLINQVRYQTTAAQEWIIKSPYTDVDIPEISYPEYIFNAAEKNNDRIALVNGMTGEAWSYEEFRDVVYRVGSGLTRLGLAKGQVLAIVSPNCPEFTVTFFGAANIGAVVTTINSTYTPDEIASQLKNSCATMVMTHPALLGNVQAACKTYPAITHIIVNGPAAEGTVSLQALMADDGEAFPSGVVIDPKEDLLVLPYSSGTTGVPKGVMLTHYNVVANLQQLTHKSLDSITKDGQDVFLGVLPFFHIYGMVPVSGLSLISGSKTVTLPMFEPKLFLDTIVKYQVSYLHTVPPIINFLTHSPMVTPEHLANVHTMVCGAAPVGKGLLGEFYKKFSERITFQEGYGMTEASPVTHLTPLGKFVPGSTGPAIPNTQMKIVDLENGTTMGPGGDKGELCVKGPQVMKGYYRNEKATKDTVDDEGWLHTGDIAVMDEDLNVYIVDRLKELIKVKGLQVAPAELEDLLRKHPEVTDVAVIGIPDARSGEVPRAYLVMNSESTATEEDVARYVEELVAPHKKLAGGVLFTSEIPKSATGKILRRILKDQALSEMEATA